MRDVDAVRRLPNRPGLVDLTYEVQGHVVSGAARSRQMWWSTPFRFPAVSQKSDIRAFSAQWESAGSQLTVGFPAIPRQALS